MMLDALRRASAAEITLVMPYYGVARQDRKVAPRAPISAKLVAELVRTAGARRLVVVDLHASQIQGFFDGPVDHLFRPIPTRGRPGASRSATATNSWWSAPTPAGSSARAPSPSGVEAPIAIIDKRRMRPNEAKAFNLIVDVRGKVAIIIDDHDRYGRNLWFTAVDSLCQNGAKKVFAVATHRYFTARHFPLHESGVEKVLGHGYRPVERGRPRIRRNSR